MKTDKKAVAQLFWTFLKIGAFTFGGGYAMIPLIQKEAAEKKKWVTEDDILDIVAIAESTPGPIAINSATFVGYKTAGVAGAFAATVGVVLPSFVLISLISLALRPLAGVPVVRYAFCGIRAGVLALILRALYAMYRSCPRHWISYVIAAGAFLAVAVWEVPVLAVIAGCAVVGLAYSLAAAGKGHTHDPS